MMARSVEIEVLMPAPAHLTIGGGFAVVRARSPAEASEYDLALAEIPEGVTVGMYSHAAAERMIRVPRPIGPDLAIMIPPLAAALAAWFSLRLELGEAAVVVSDEANVSRWLALAAQWYGGMPVVASTSRQGDLGVDLPEPICSESPDGLVDSIRRDTANRPGWTGLECTGRPEMLEVMLDAVPKWGRIALADQSSSPATIDFYNNVHRKGVRLSGVSLSTTEVFSAREDSSVHQFASRAARILAHPALGARCRILSTQPARHA